MNGRSWIRGSLAREAMLEGKCGPEARAVRSMKTKWPRELP